MNKAHTIENFYRDLSTYILKKSIPSKNSVESLQNHTIKAIYFGIHKLSKNMKTKRNIQILLMTPNPLEFKELLECLGVPLPEVFENTFEDLEYAQEVVRREIKSFYQNEGNRSEIWRKYPNSKSSKNQFIEAVQELIQNGLKWEVSETVNKRQNFKKFVKGNLQNETENSIYEVENSTTHGQTSQTRTLEEIRVEENLSIVFREYVREEDSSMPREKEECLVDELGYLEEGLSYSLTPFPFSGLEFYLSDNETEQFNF